MTIKDESSGPIISLPHYLSLIVPAYIFCARVCVGGVVNHQIHEIFSNKHHIHKVFHLQKENKFKHFISETLHYLKIVKTCYSYSI